VALVLAALVAAAWVVFTRHVYQPPEALAPAAAAPLAVPSQGPVPEATPAPEGAAVLSVEGTVERSGAPGAWIPLRAGDLLRADDALRTGVASRAELAIGERSRLTVAEATDLTVREVTRVAHHFRLRRGRIAADYQPDGERVLRVEDESGQVAVEATAARFHVASVGVTLAVAAETGRVHLRTAAGDVDLRAGEQSSARPGTAPAAAAPIPPEVLLRLAGAGQDLPGACADVRGRVAPGTRVTVDGEAAEVGGDGRFALRRRRSRGPVVRVVAIDPAGRRAERELACRDAWHPVSDLELKWGHGARD